jgi:hypothetical protein
MTNIHKPPNKMYTSTPFVIDPCPTPMLVVNMSPTCSPSKKKSFKKPPAPAPQSNCLTQGQWVNEVFPFVDTHCGLRLEDVVNYFATCQVEDGGPLTFHKSSLSQSLKHCDKIEAQAEAIPHGANLKQMSATLYLEVDHVLCLWFMNMQSRREVIHGDMIVEKHHHIEDILNIPDSQWPKSDGWLPGRKLRQIYFPLSSNLILH